MTGLSRSMLAAIAIAVALAGCGSDGSGRAEHAVPPLAASGPVVPVTADGIHQLVARPGARATIVNVWAAWCAPCREEFPALLSAARARRDAGLRLVLVSADWDDQLPAVRAFLAGHGVADTTYLKSGDEQQFINGLSPRWSGSLPATFVYDARGRLVDQWEGMADEQRFTSAVDRTLAAAHP